MAARRWYGLLVALVLAVPVGARGAPPVRDWLVRFASSEPSALAQLGTELAAAGLPAVRLQRLPLPGAVRLRFAAAVSEATLRPLLAALAPLRWLEPNRRWHPLVVPNDPEWTQEWGLHNTGQRIAGFADPADCDWSVEDCSEDPGTAGVDVGAPGAWERTQGDATVLVGVVDTGVDYRHPDLAPNMWRNDAEAQGLPGVDDDGNGYVDDVWGWDVCDGDGDPWDPIGHGTSVAAVIGARGDDAFGVAGVAWQVGLVAIRFMGPLPQAADSDCNLTSGALMALDYAERVGVDVVNLSWGGPEDSQALRDKLAELVAAGIVVVAAAGNDGVSLDDEPIYPAAYDLPGLLVVAAHTNDGNLASFSNFGSFVHVAAPGVNVRTATPAYDDAWARRNFNGFTGVPGPVGGRLLGTNFTAVDGNWGLAQLTTGDWALVADFQCTALQMAAGTCDVGGWLAHRANLDQTIESDSFDARAWGSALLGFELVYDLGQGAAFWVEYSVDGGPWRSLPQGVGRFTGSGGGMQLLDLGAVVGEPLPTDLRIRFRLQTQGAYEGNLPGGVYLYDLTWRAPGNDYAGGDVFTLAQGTSLAAPFAAGGAALVRALAPAATPVDVVRLLAYRSSRLRQTDVDLPGRYRLDLTEALRLGPLLTWSGRRGYHADGVEPDQGPVGTTFAFEVAVVDPYDEAGVSAAAVRLEAPGGGVRWVDLQPGAHATWQGSVVLDQEGTYQYRFVVTGATGTLAGAPAQTQLLAVGTGSGGATTGAGADGTTATTTTQAVPPPQGEPRGCGCRLGGGGGLSELWPWLPIWWWRRRRRPVAR